jgi:hypothetical protein
MSASNSLRGRVPGQAAMSEVIAAQNAHTPRSRLARIFGVSPLAPGTRALYRTAIGELVVGDALDNLGPEWDVLHVIPIAEDDGEIDHLVIGPPGVFSIATENFPGEDIWVGGETLLVGSRHDDGIPKAKQLARSASGILTDASGQEVVVEPILVIVNPRKLVLREQPSGLIVVSSKQLLRWLTRLERTMFGDDVAKVSDVADRNSTWQSSAGSVTDAEQLYRDFAVIREQVTGATRTRILWGVGAFVVVGICVWVGTAIIVQHLLAR